MAEKWEIYYDEDPHSERDNVPVMRLAHIWRIHQAGTGAVCDDSLTTSSINPISTIDLGSDKKTHPVQTRNCVLDAYAIARLLSNPVRP